MTKEAGDSVVLTRRAVRPFSADFSRIRDIYGVVFPPHEQMSLWLLLALSATKTCGFYAYYDGEDFVGFSHGVRLASEYHLMYLAVNPAAQSRGYGSAILDIVKRDAGNLPLALDIEPMDEAGADNQEQRDRRLAFYKRNGFHETGHRLVESDGDTYDILATDPDYDPRTLAAEFKRWSRGIYAPAVVSK